ncbi:SLC13 family permease [Pseudooceanicola sp. 502str34]|uniref:SLC13 family permease n=1 Tax=Maritimibacter alkaliphilus TaxID=404236 RepID=UPI001C94BB9C|nr:SLC13 family permease [Maritimibacter alkaliphilus]MBY6089619.1 anion permease [Maritimibacter alkaliphilus]
MAYGKHILFGLIALLAAVVAVTAPGGLTPDQAQILAIVLMTLGLWATGLLPAYLTSLMFFTALLLFGLVDKSVVFSGFTSTAMWLVVSGFVIGAAIGQSGLGQKIGAHVAPHLSRSYPMLVAGMVGLGMGLSFLMPSSMGRAMVLVPVGMALADVLGFRKGTKGRTGVALAIAMSTNVPGFTILPANVPNMVLSGTAENLLDIHIGYTDYLLLHFPVLGLLKSALMVAAILFLCPAKAQKSEDAAFTPVEGSGRHGWLLTILLVTLALWATDWLHGLPAAWVGLAAAVLLLMPGIGFLNQQQFRGAVDFGTLLLVAGVLALGVVVTSAGLGDRLAAVVTAALPLAPGRDLTNFFSLAALGTLTSILTTMPGVPAVMTPLTQDLAQATGFSTEAVLMSQVLGFSTVVFPYQAPPLLVAMGLAGEHVRSMIRLTLLMTLLTFVILIPLDFLWWKLLGVI